MRRTALLCASLCVLVAVLAVSSAGAQLPPQKFYGTDATVGGRAAPDGATVRAVNESGSIVARATISGGAWYLDVDPRKAQSVRFAIGGSGLSGAYSVTSGAITNVSLVLGGSVRAREPLEPPLVPGWELYTLQSGDTLTELAGLYGISLDDLLANNPHVTDPSELRTGDVIRLRRLHEITPAPPPLDATPLEVRVPPVPMGASPSDPTALFGIAGPVTESAPAVPPAVEAVPDAEPAPNTATAPAATPGGDNELITWQRLVLGVIAIVLLGLLAAVLQRGWARIMVPRTPPPARPRRRSTRFQRRGVIQSAPPNLFDAPAVSRPAPAATASAGHAVPWAATATAHSAPASATDARGAPVSARPLSVGTASAAAGSLAVAPAMEPETHLEALRALLDSVRSELDALRREVSSFRAPAPADAPTAAAPPQPADRRYFRTTPGADGHGPHGRGFPIHGAQPLRPVPERESRLRALRESQRATAQQTGVAARIASLTDRAGGAWLRRD